MAKIEDILYEAHSLGLREKVFEKVGKMKIKEKYKYVELSTVYEKAFLKVKEKSKNLEEII